MERIDTPLAGAFLIKPRLFTDERGVFIKSFHAPTLEKWGVDFHLREAFHSISKKNALRGMHFQTPPCAHHKIVQCVRGTVLDVILDLRKDSPTFGHSFSQELSDTNGLIFFIPEGFAHGFLSLTDDSIVTYQTSREYAPDHDTGVRWDSFGFDWPATAPIVSARDQTFPVFTEFANPF